MSSNLFRDARIVVDDAFRALPEERARLGQIRDRLDGPLRVAIAGRVKAGKSTLLNALVREELAPTDAGECTKVVTWYQGGRSRSVTIVPRTGSPSTARWVRNDGAIDVELSEWALDDIHHLEVQWPSPELSSLTLVDTPGLASSRAEVSARSTSYLGTDDATAPGEADAVVYLLRHLHPEDVAFFESFTDVLSGDSAAVNATGVLSRADEIGGAALDSLDVAQSTVERYAVDPRLRSRLQVIVPVAGLLAMSAVSLTESDMRDLRMLALLPLRVANRAMRSAGGFLVDDGIDLSPGDRERMLDRFGLFGIRFGVEQLRMRDLSAADLSALLSQRSGIGDLRRVLRTQFGDRARVLKARTALAMVKSMTARSSSPDAVALANQIHAIELGAHEFTEIRTLQLLRTLPNLSPLMPLDEAARILGDDGPAPWQRLALDPIASDDDVRDEAMGAITRWRTALQDEFADRPSRELAAAVVRSLEGMVAAR